MNAFNTVNLAGAVILTSTDYAKELGIPERKWIYALGGAGTSDSADCKCRTYHHRPKLTSSLVWLRPDYHSSASISRSIDVGLHVSGLSKADVDLHCLYSYVRRTTVKRALTDIFFQMFPHRPQICSQTPRSLNRKPRETNDSTRRSNILRRRRQ